MKSSVALFLFGLLVFVATTSARPRDTESDLSTFDEERDLEHSIAQNREHFRSQRRRHSRQTSDRYDYFSLSEFDILRRNQRIINEKLDELLEIYVKNPRPSPIAPTYAAAPQPIFIPVPYYLNAPSDASCKKNINLPTIGNRQQVDDGSGNSINPPDEDDDDDDDDEEDDYDEGRPVSFKPHNTNNPQGRPSPPVEHGSVQAGLSKETTTTARPTTKKLPGACEAAILMCCRFPKDAHAGCFKQYGCTMTYKTGLACLPKTLALVIQHFKEAYAPS